MSTLTLSVIYLLPFLLGLLPNSTIYHQNITLTSTPMLYSCFGALHYFIHTYICREQELKDKS